MKNFITFTSHFATDDLSKKLTSVGFKPEEDFIITSNWEAIRMAIKDNQIKVVLVDGGIRDPLLADCLRVAKDAMVEFVASTKILMCEENHPSPGVIFIGDLKKIWDYL